VVRPDLALMFRALNEVLPLLEGSDVLVVDFVVPLNGGQGFGEESNRVPLFVFRGYLGEDRTRCKVGAVDFDVVLESVLKHSLFLSYCFIFFDKLIVCNKLCIFLGRYFV